MNLFIDANIFLDFYHFADDDLDQLKKLIDYINKGDINLIITSQLIDEVKRNRDNKVADAYNKFKESKAEMNMPQICKAYPEYLEISKTLKDLRQLKKDLDEKICKDIKNRTLKADEIINQLFAKSQLIDTEKYFLESKTRYELGNPPGKQGSYGDSLNWVSLVSELNDKEDLFFISGDSDFKSPIDELLLNAFLNEEWETKKKSKIFFYTKLSDFFSKHYTDIELKVEKEKSELIDALENSSNFASTHSIIWRLSKYVSFTDEQIRKISAIAVNNSQVYSILSDSDVRSFYENLLDNKQHILDKDTYQSIMTNILEYEDDSDNQTIPF